MTKQGRFGDQGSRNLPGASPFRSRLFAGSGISASGWHCVPAQLMNRYLTPTISAGRKTFRYSWSEITDASIRSEELAEAERYFRLPGITETIRGQRRAMVCRKLSMFQNSLLQKHPIAGFTGKREFPGDQSSDFPARKTS